MAPKAEVPLKGFIKSILRQAGPDSPYAKNKKIQAERALVDRDYKRLHELSGELTGLQNLPNTLQEIYDQCMTALRYANLHDKIFQFGDQSEPKTAVELVQVADKMGIDTAKQEVVAERIKGEWKVENAQPIALLELLKKDKQGKFIHSSQLSIASLIVKDEYKKDKKTLRSTADTIKYWKNHQADALEYDKDNEKTIRTVKDAYEDLRNESINKGDEAWFDYYDYAIGNYGSMPISRFKKEVLLRDLRGRFTREEPLHTRKKKVTERQSNTNEAGEQHPSKEVKRVFDHPIMSSVEVTLSGKFRNEKIMNGIETKVLDGQDPYRIAGSNGWNHRVPENAKSMLEKSAINAKSKIDAQIVRYNDREVFCYLRDRVMPILRSKDKDRKIAARIVNKTEFEAIKFLNALLRSFNSDERMKKSDETLSILFQDNRQQLNAMECY